MTATIQITCKRGCICRAPQTETINRVPCRPEDAMLKQAIVAVLLAAAR
jgi:hypothetical protein